MAFLTDFPADLDRREAEQSGEWQGSYWQPQSRALAASFKLWSASRWLLAADQCTSFMATHAVTMAAHDIEDAAAQLKDEPALAWDAAQLAWRCGEALKHTAYPFVDDLPEAVEALQARVDKLQRAGGTA